MEQWKIRILSGVHSGVEVNLPSGSFVLGSDDFIADVVLTDSGIKASHLTIETNEEAGCTQTGPHATSGKRSHPVLTARRADLDCQMWPLPCQQCPRHGEHGQLRILDERTRCWSRGATR